MQGYAQPSSAAASIGAHTLLLEEMRYMSVPSNLIGTLVGTRGSTLRRIGEDSGCKVVLPRPAPGMRHEGDVQLELKGRPDQLDIAVNMVEQILSRGPMGPKRKADGSVEGFEMRDGDWLCPACNNHNFRDKLVCNKCAHPRPADCPLPENIKARYMRSQGIEPPAQGWGQPPPVYNQGYDAQVYAQYAAAPPPQEFAPPQQQYAPPPQQYAPPPQQGYGAAPPAQAVGDYSYGAAPGQPSYVAPPPAAPPPAVPPAAPPAVPSAEPPPAASDGTVPQEASGVADPAGQAHSSAAPVDAPEPAAAGAAPGSVQPR